MLFGIVLLIVCYVVAVGFAVRMYLYNRTGEQKYKHDLFCWHNTYVGKHEEK